MARLSRITVPGLPHHVTQRGNRRQALFTQAGDYAVAAHRAGRDDALVDVGPVLERAPRFSDLLEMSLAEQMALEGFETKSANGRPLERSGVESRKRMKKIRN